LAYGCCRCCRWVLLLLLLLRVAARAAASSRCCCYACCHCRFKLVRHEAELTHKGEDVQVLDAWKE
jgi:hypothetical protein